jgi:predicted Fe-S protein YdhL (DUF1289 family)
VSCSGFYRMLHEYAEWLKLEREFRRRLRRVLRKWA